MEVRDLFVETKKIVAEYKAKAEVLDKEEQELQAELVAMQEEMTWFETSVVSKNEMFSATRGNLPDHLQAPKEAE